MPKLHQLRWNNQFGKTCISYKINNWSILLSFNCHIVFFLHIKTVMYNYMPFHLAFLFLSIINCCLTHSLRLWGFLPRMPNYHNFKTKVRLILMCFGFCVCEWQYMSLGTGAVILAVTPDSALHVSWLCF